MAKYQIKISVRPDTQGNTVSASKVGQIMFDLHTGGVLGEDRQMSLSLGLVNEEGFKHFAEITFELGLEEFAEACVKLNEMGIPLGKKPVVPGLSFAVQELGDSA